MSLAYADAALAREPKPAALQRVLIVADGSERTNRLVDYCLTLGAQMPMEVLILNVQPEPEDWRLRGYGSFKRTEIRERLIEDLGQPIVSSVARKLKARGIRHRMRVEIGDPAETVIRVAEEENCELIVLPEPRANAVTRWLARNAGIYLGSVTAQIVGLSETPVLIAK